MNTVQILGNLGKDPDIRATNTGKTVASFSVAVSRKYTTPQGERINRLGERCGLG